MPSLHALCCGRLSFDRSLFNPRAAPGSTMTAPVPSFLVVHPKGRLLFDTGIRCDAAADPVASVGARIASLYALTGAPDENIVGQLARQGLAPADITHVANSHLHFDHCGCNNLFPHAKFLLQRSEMDAAAAPGSRYDRKQWDFPLDYQLIDGEHDVFGDGSVLLFPTPGHTAGHQSMIVTTSRDRRFVLTADACYTRENFDADILPSVVWDGPTMLDSMARLRSLGQRAGTQLLFGHDPDQWLAIEASNHLLT